MVKITLISYNYETLTKRKKMKIFKIATLLMFLSTLGFSKEYVILSDTSSAEFNLKYKKTEDIKGIFNDISGVIKYDENSSKINSLSGEVSVDFIENIDNKLISIIVSEKILDSSKYPTIKFNATKIDENRIFGDVIIKDVKRNIEFELINNGVFLNKLYLTLKGKIKRSYFDLSWDELLDSGSVAFSNDVYLNINLEAKLKNDIEFQFKKEKKSLK